MPSLEGGTAKRSHGALFIALGVIAILFATLFFISSAITRAETVRFQYESREVAGEIEGLQGTLLLKNFSVAYKYIDDDGEIHHNSSPYPFQDAGTLKEGQKIDVIYMPRLPDQSRLAARQILLVSKLKDTPWLMIFSIAFGGFITIAIGVNRLQREWRSSH